jgi:hypothetical protein
MPPAFVQWLAKPAYTFSAPLNYGRLEVPMEHQSPRKKRVLYPTSIERIITVSLSQILLNDVISIKATYDMQSLSSQDVSLLEAFQQLHRTLVCLTSKCLHSMPQARHLHLIAPVQLRK